MSESNGMPAAAAAKPREHRSSLIVTALSSAFGVVLVQATSYLAAIISGDKISERQSAQLALIMVAGVFIVIAVYVAAIVTANTFATVIAGRTRTIALLRLVGASASALRAGVAREGLMVGVIGSLAGALLGLIAASVGIRLAAGAGAVPNLDYVLVDPLVLLPMAAVAVATWAAAGVGSRSVLTVTPIQATGAAIDSSREESMRRPVRNVLALVLAIGGTATLIGGALYGMVSMMGFLVAFLGGVLSFTGVILGAHLFVPPVLRVTGALLGSTPAARLAAGNAVRYPERSTRTTIGLVIGVTLITTFLVAAEGFVDIVLAAQEQSPGIYQDIEVIMAVLVSIFSVLVGFSALIAAVGMVNNLSLSVLQRTRELGLLRALGFTGRQVRGMITAESAQLTLTGVGLGLILGVAYGWAGAVSLLGQIPGSPGMVAPSVPWPFLIVLALAATVLVLVAAQAPARRAVTVSPVSALAAD